MRTLIRVPMLRNGSHNRCIAHLKPATRTSSGRPRSRIATESGAHRTRRNLRSTSWRNGPDPSVGLSILAVVGFEDPLGDGARSHVPRELSAPFRRRLVDGLILPQPRAFVFHRLANTFLPARLELTGPRFCRFC